MCVMLSFGEGKIEKLFGEDELFSFCSDNFILENFLRKKSKTKQKLHFGKEKAVFFM